MTTEFKHPPTPPAIPVNRTLIVADLPVEAREPFDPHSMSIGAVSVAELMKDLAA